MDTQTPKPALQTEPSTAQPTEPTPATPLVEPPKKPWLEETIKRFGSLRDGILTGAGVVYVCGYGVWAYNSWRNNLGLLPALQYQYFVAGLTLLFILAFSLLILYWGMGIELISAKLNNWQSKKVPGKPKGWSPLWFKYKFVPFLLSITVLVGGSWLMKHFVTNPFAYKFSRAVWAYFLVCFLWGQWYPRQQEQVMGLLPSKPSLKNLNIGIMGLRVIGTQAWTVGYLLLVTYFVSGYASIPQEFGGAKPRLAYFDVKRADVSAQTRADLLPVKLRDLPADPSKDPLAVARTVMVDVYYNSTDFYLVRPHGAKVETPVTQVKKETVQGVRWLGYSEPAPEKEAVPINRPLAKRTPPPAR